MISDLGTVSKKLQKALTPVNRVDKKQPGQNLFAVLQYPNKPAVMVLFSDDDDGVGQLADYANNSGAKDVRYYRTTIC